MPTYIDGIGASENLDSSGERIIIAGMDISSLALDGTFTYEHEQGVAPDGQKISVKTPDQTVGKILKAKKIFSDKDCENERELYFWNKVQVPYIYVMGELFDDFKASAKEVAGMFMYDAAKKGKQERNVMNFSIEGGYIARNGADVIRSVARKCTITVNPCNKAAIAEMVPSDQKKKGDIDLLFKTEVVEIEVLKVEKVPAQVNDMAKHAEVLGIEPMEKAAKHLTLVPGGAKEPAAPAAGDKAALPSPTSNPGKSIGQTKSGKDVFSHAKIHDYHDFNAEDHRNAANLHGEAANQANTSKNWKLADHHNQKMKLHNSAAVGLERKANRLNVGKQQKHAKFMANQVLGKSEAKLNKALEAGSGLSVPSAKVQGAALEPLGKPYASEAQRRWAHTTKGKKALGGESAVREWDKATKGKKLPEHVAKNELQKARIDEGKSVEEKKAARSDRNVATSRGGVPHLKSQLNPTLGPKWKGKDLSADLKHRKRSLGESYMGHALRDRKEGTFSAKEIAQRQLKRLKSAPKPNLTKSEWNERAEQEYQKWPDREKFQAFMKERMPQLTKGEIDAWGRTLALKKALDAEKSLEKIVGKKK